MRILFLQGGLPHYYSLVLNKLNQFPGIEIGLIVPKNTSLTVGSGVEQNRNDVNFRLFELPEFKTFYGKPFFRGFEKTIQEFNPDIVLTGYPYMMHFVFYKKLYRKLKMEGRAFIYKDIPFNIPPFGEAKKFFQANRNLTESLSQRKNEKWEEVKFRMLTLVRKLYLQLVDAYIFYIPEAIPLMQTYGIQPERIFISANSPDTDILLETLNRVQSERPLLPPNNFRLIHVGRLVKWKRVDLILEAVRNLQSKFPEIELLIAGYGPEEENLKKLTGVLGLEKCVQFLGGIYEPNLLGHYLYESSIYILGGMGGLSINDAMCFGKPIVCTMADGTEKRLVREGENGYFFENGNAQDLELKVEMILQDPEKVKDFGQRSLEIIQKEINIHTVLDSYIKAFHFAISQVKPIHKNPSL